MRILEIAILSGLLMNMVVPVRAQRMVIVRPVASMWIKPDPQLSQQLIGPWLGSREVPDHDTQLLYGERIELLEVGKGDWIRVKSLDQPWFNTKEENWSYCSGWIKKDSVKRVDIFQPRNLVVIGQYITVYAEAKTEAQALLKLSCGSLLQGEDLKNGWHQITLLDDRKGFVQSSGIATLDTLDVKDGERLRGVLVDKFYDFIGSPYCWGGRSAYMCGALTSVDCSSLFNLMFLSCGLRIPRNSGCQYRLATKKELCDLKPGDFLFLKDNFSKVPFSRITHIMIYLGDDEEGCCLLGEATGRDELPDKQKTTQIIKDTERFGISLKKMKNGMRVGDFEFYGGTFFDGIDLQVLREVLR